MQARAPADVPRRAVEIAGVAAIYYVAARLGLLLAFERTNASPVWPPSGIALTAVLLWGSRVWPGIYLGAALANISVFLANRAAAFPALIGASLVIGIGNTLEAVVGGWLLRRSVHADNPFERSSDVFKFLVVALVASLVSAGIGPTAIALSGIVPWSDYAIVWFTWWLGDAVGIVVVAPPLLSWWPRWRVAHEPHRWAELLALFSLLFVVSQIIFGTWIHEGGADYPPGFLLVPLLAWLALRFDPRESSTGVLFFTTIAVWQTVRGIGPFVQDAIHVSLLLTSAHVGALALTTLAMCATATERRRTEQDLRNAQQELEGRVRERTAELTASNLALRKNERQLREAQQIAHIGSWEWDLVTNAVRWSDELYRIYGLTPAAFGATFESFLERVHPDDRETTKRIIETACRTGQPFSCYEQIVRPDGAVQVLHSRGEVEADEAGRPVRLFGTCQDVTESKRVEQALANQAELLELTQDAILVRDMSGMVTYWNRGAEARYGWPRAEALGRFSHALLQTEFPRPFAEIEAELIRSGHWEGELMQTSRDGTRITVASRWAVQKDQSGQPTGVLEINTDITQHKEMEERLRQTERLAAIGQMAAGLAHDSRNALQQIQASVDRLKKRLKEGTEAQLVADIQQAHDRLLRLLEDIRGYAAPVKLDRRVHNLAEIWREAWRQLAPFRKGRTAKLKEALEDIDLNCFVDQMCLERVFHNIMLNSLAACGDPTVIEVNCSERSINRQPAVCVQIRDNGPGLNHEQRERIFQPFFTTKTHGTGLGMSITKRIVEAHGGRIEVDAGTTPGATILITLPRRTTE